mgnify:CR=1 FL=1
MIKFLQLKFLKWTDLALVSSHYLLIAYYKKGCCTAATFRHFIFPRRMVVQYLRF